MKKILFFLSALSVATVSNAQQPVNQNWCGSTDAMEAHFKKHPELKKQFEDYQAQADAQQNTNAQRTAVVNYTIPVVFHVLHQNGNENISDAQIADQVAILNRDFNLQNTDTNVVVSSMKSAIGNMHINFVLAKLDPNGNCTSGITRHYDSKTLSWEGDPGDYLYTWDPTKYLNFYTVSNIASGAAGYAYYPGSLSYGDDMDAILILHSYVGSIGTSSALHSRAVTHEVGHWLNLQHVWGNSNNPGVACGNDQVSDTPLTKGFTTCPSPAGSQVCTPGVYENYQNYMDYSYCCVMFTNGQGVRMTNATNSGVVGRNNLGSVSNLAATGVSPEAPCAPNALFVSNRQTVCTGQTINYTDMSNISTPTSWAWTFEGGTPATSAVQNPTVTYNTPGTYSVQLIATNNVGASIPETKINYITVSTATAIAGNMYEGFEGAPVPNSMWAIKNVSGNNYYWQQTSAGAATGNNSVYVDESIAPGYTVELISQPFDFSQMPNVALTLKWAGAERDVNTASADVFTVLFSSNCGLTWQPRLIRNMKTTVPGVSGVVNGGFIPTSAQFKQEAVPLGGFTGSANVLMKLRFISDAGSSNNFYVDDINLTSLTDIKETTPVLNLLVYPNPAKEQVFVSFDLLKDKQVNVNLKNVLGQTLYATPMETFTNGQHEVSIPVAGLSAGIYFITINTDGVLTTQKIVVE